MSTLIATLKRFEHATESLMASQSFAPLGSEEIPDSAAPMTVEWWLGFQEKIGSFDIRHSNSLRTESTIRHVY
ncbi:MAG: hypothetical protein ABF581_01170 [Bifidobacterium sp.]